MRNKRACAALFIGLLMLIAIKVDLYFTPMGGMSIAVAAESKEPASSSDLDVVIINNKDYKSKRRGPVSFTHLKHAKNYGISCWTCHHEYEDSTNVWVPWSETPKCSDCHDPGKGEGKMVGLQKAYHVECRGCHQTLKDQGKKTGPYRGCFGCHEKEK
jgi:hypothetical protein